MSVDDTIAALQKKYKITIGHLDSDKIIKVPVIPTGLLELDIALGIGGIPRGYFTEIYSQEGVGKTTLSMQIVAQAQKLGLDTAYIDMEHRVDPEWAKTLGVDISKLYFTQPPYGEAALNIAKALIRGGVSLIIIDSVPALTPKSEWEGETGDQFVGLLPRMLAQNIRQMVHHMKEHDAAVVFTNQVRAKIGGMGSLATGPGQTTPGGWALKHNASVRMDMRKIQTIKDKDGMPTGHKVKVTIKKNSLASPYRDALLYMKYGVGFDQIEGLIDHSISLGFIEQAGAWFTVNGEKVQGRISLYDYISGHKEVMESLTESVVSVLCKRE